MTALAVIDRGMWVSLADSDRDLLETQLKELSEEYRNGIKVLDQSVSTKHSTVAAIRISGPDNQTLHYYGPDQTDRPSIERLNPMFGRPWAHFHMKDGAVMDVVKARLNDGNYIQVARSDHSRRFVMRHFERVSALMLAPMLLLAAIGGGLLASRLLHPVREINDAVRKIIATGRTDARLHSQTTAGELRDLVAAFNEMLARIDALIQTLKGTLDNVAHDLRTPLSRLRGIAELTLQNGSNPEAMRDALADCVEESERVATLLNTIMDITEVEAGAMKLQLQSVSLPSLAEEIVELYQHVAEEKGVTLISRSQNDLTVLADANRLRQAIANLVDNAVKYTPAGGTVCVVADVRKGVAALTVEDTGIGIPSEEQSRVWERLYRTDASRSARGLGLGLSLVRAIMQAHQGSAELVSSPGSGSAFTLTFPTVKA
jgi:signal transduction histidine kinase